MRKRQLALILCLAALACSDQPQISEPHDGSRLLVQRLIELGFNGAEIVDEGDHFIVEKDIRISKKSSLFHAPWHADIGPMQGMPRQDKSVIQQYGGTNGLVNSGIVGNIKVDLSGIAGLQHWYDAAISAIAEWNQLAGTKVTIATGSPAHITFGTYWNSNSSVAAHADFPSGGNPGAEIEVNLNFHSSTHNILTLAIAHEIGHAVGFRHTDTSEGDRVPGTPGSESSSVMNSSHTTGWNGFSFYDQYSIQWMYNTKFPSSGYNVVNQGGNPYLTWPNVLRGPAAYYSVQLEVEYQQYNEQTGESSSSIYSLDGVGTPTGTSLVDTQNAWTGESTCPGQNNSMYYSEFWVYTYEVYAVFSTGLPSLPIRMPAPVGNC